MSEKRVTFSYTEVKETKHKNTWDTVKAKTDREAIRKVKKEIERERGVKIKNFKVKKVEDYVEPKRDYSSSTSSECENHCGC